MQCTTPQKPPEKECVHIDITVSPTIPRPQPSPSAIPAKLLAIMRKYKFNWRLEQLSIPRVLTKKYVPKFERFITPPKPPPTLNDEKKFYADQMGRPKLKNLYENRRFFSDVGKGQKEKYDKNIAKSWDSIYNFYRKKERDRKLRKLRQQQKKKGKKREVNQKIFDNLAIPKPVFKPEATTGPTKVFDNYDRLDDLASPKPHHMEPPKSLGVNPHALTYEPTEIVMRLAKLPARFLNVPPPLEPGKVKRGALKYKATPRIEEIAQPKQKHEKIKEDEAVDPFAVSKNALKYKPTPRILELAKPVERD